MRGLTDLPGAQAAFNRRLDPDSESPIAIALSGGGDSMALLMLAQVWAARHGRRLLALTVDHGLHPDSAEWTAFAGAAARRHGADWRALRWTGEKPKTGLPAAARAARHGLLADAARDAGATVILFAHTADDVVEGEVMRAAAAPTLGHLKGWSPSPAWPQGRGVFILRPLLQFRRDALRDVLRLHGQAWLDDPANDDPRFARARARAALAGEPRADFSAQPEGNDTRLADLARTVQAYPDGRLTIARATLQKAEHSIAKRLLSAALICASGHTSPPRGEALDRLLDRLAHDAPFTAALAGGRIEADETEVAVLREAGDMARHPLSPLLLLAGQSAVWDGRFEIAAQTPSTIGPLAGSAARLGKSDRARLAEVAAAFRPALPAIFQDETVRLPRPFGDGAAHAHALSHARFAAACGLIEHERDISPPCETQGMAQTRRSSYVEALALA